MLRHPGLSTFVSPVWMSLALWNPGWFFAFFPGPASWLGANSVRRL